MNQKEQLALLSGTEDQKRQLMNVFLDTLLEGQELTEAENAMFECLRAYFVDKPTPVVVDMSATMFGKGQARTA